MKHLRGFTPLEQQFLHVDAAPSKKGQWVWPLLAVSAVALAVGLGSTLLPLPKASRDFRQDIPRPDRVAANGAAEGFELIGWPDLMPEGWNPTQQLRKMQEAERFVFDSDPRAAATLSVVRRDSLVATSGYQLVAVAVDPYEPAQKQ